MCLMSSCSSQQWSPTEVTTDIDTAPALTC